MQGYTNLFKMRLSPKTLENSFFVMNSQVWTNQKQHLSTVQNGNLDEVATDRCGFCEQTETTTQLLLECRRYAKPSCSRALMP